MASFTAPRPGVRPRWWRLLYAGVMVVVVLWMVGRDMTFMRRAFVYDVFIYQCYARGFWQGPQGSIVAAPETRACAPFWGQTPKRFHTFPREYPAPALAVFSLPLLTPWLPYNAAYLLWMALLLLLATGVIAWRGPPMAAVAFPLYVLLAGWQFVLFRYDLAPGLCVLLALAFLRGGRWRAATVMLAVGTLMKGFPAFLLPVALMAQRRQDGRWRLDCPLIFAALMFMGLAPAFLVNPAGLLAPLGYAAHRPLHVESLSGALLWLLDLWSGHRARIVFSYGSYNVEGMWQGIVAAVFSVLLVVGLACVYWRQWRGRVGVERAFMLVLIVVLVSNKVFSPQYILWLLPTVAYVEGVRVRWLIVATLVFFISGDGALPFVTEHLHPFLPPGRFPTPSFVVEILACHVALCGIALFYERARGLNSGGELANGVTVCPIASYPSKS